MTEGIAWHEVLTRTFRREHGRVISVLIRELSDFDRAEEALAEATAEAVAKWPTTGIPDNPAAWLLTVARRRAVDHTRRDVARRNRQDRVTTDPSTPFAKSATEDHAEDVVDDLVDLSTTIPDERLALLFTCCHPALGMEARIALTLRTVAGLSTAEIARAFLTNEPTMRQRLTRAKHKIRDAAIPYRVPRDDELPARRTGLLGVVYLIFNEGYSSASGPRLMRTDLAEEAIRLARILHQHLPDDPETAGLLALMLLTHARAATRTDAAGKIVQLEHQDRSCWDRGMIDEGAAIIRTVMDGGVLGTYGLQAAIARQHAMAATFAQTDWVMIVRLYDLLRTAAPSPVIDLNAAVAVAQADGPQAGLARLEPLLADATLTRYHPLHVVRAELLMRTGEHEAAAASFRRALELVGNDAERAHLVERLDAANG